MSNFTWWYVENGAAVPVQDTPEISAAIDAGATGYYGSLEGAIVHGGVIATAFKQKTECTYDAQTWLETGAMVPIGQVTTITITAKREA